MSINTFIPACLIAFSLAACASDNTGQILASTPDAVAGVDFPKSPDANLTPGTICQSSKEKRYPEGIVYCGRHVSTEEKNSVIQEYDLRLGFRVEVVGRNKFKIDHFIPLCMGGSNDPENLWPQHQSIYGKTDKIETMLCSLMEKGALKQIEAIAKIKYIKYNLSEVATMTNELQSQIKIADSAALDH